MSAVRRGRPDRFQRARAGRATDRLAPRARAGVPRVAALGREARACDSTSAARCCTRTRPARTSRAFAPRPRTTTRTKTDELARARAAHRPDAGAGRRPRAGRAVLERSECSRCTSCIALIAGAVLRRWSACGASSWRSARPTCRPLSWRADHRGGAGRGAGAGRADAAAERRSAARRPALSVRRVGHPDAAAGASYIVDKKFSRSLAFGLASLFMAGLAIGRSRPASRTRHSTGRGAALP